MKTIAKQSILTTLSSYLGVIIGYINILWLLPYALEPDQIGLFRTIQDMALLLVPFAQLGLGNGLTKFFPQTKENQYAFFTLSLFVTGLGFLLVLGLFLVFRDSIVSAFAENSPEVIDFLGVVMLITLFSVLNTILDAFCRSFLKIAFPTFVREVLLRLLVSILVGIYLLGYIDFLILMWGLGLVYFAALLATLLYMVHEKLFRLDWNFRVFPKEFIGEFLKYSLITFLGTTGAVLIMKIDSLMVSSMIGLEANAIYTIGFSIAIVIEMPRRAVSQVAMPLISEYFSQSALGKINSLYKEIAVHQLLICLLLFIGIWANIENIYHFVPGNELYSQGKWVVFLIGLGKILDIMFSVNGEIIIFSRHYVFNITATLLMSVAVIVLNLILIPQFGLEGAAFASLLAMVFYNLLKYIYLKRKLDFDPFSWDIVKITGLGLVTYAIQYYLFKDSQSGLSDILIRSTCITGIYLCGIYFLGIAKSTQLSLFEKVKRLKP